jgi:hypothetical protein
MIQPNPTSPLPRVFLNHGHIPELPLREIMRLIGIHAGGDVPLGLYFEMRAHFMRHLGVEFLPAEK